MSQTLIQDDVVFSYSSSTRE